jgi:RNA polymerase sigma-70 factor (ECF subfamily)
MTTFGLVGQSIGVALRNEPDADPPPTARLLGDLFHMHAAYVWNSLRRLGAPPSDLEDLTHEVFVQVYRHLGEFDPDKPVRPWLFGFAFRIASQHRRRAHRRREIPGEPDVAADPAALPDERAAREEDRRLVLAALQGIELDRRAVFVLYEIDGLPMGEIAGSLGIPVNTAYSRLRVARAEFVAAVKRLRPGRAVR